MSRAEIIAACDALRAAGLPPSRAVAIVRGASRLDGPVGANVPVALDLLAVDLENELALIRSAATLLRQAGTLPTDLPAVTA